MDLMLFERWQAATGVEKARILNRMVELEMPLVRSCVRTVLARSGAGEAEDLEQVGAIGLLSVIRKWDPAKGAWASYARRHVTEAIRRALPEQSLIHVSVTTWDHRLTKEQLAKVISIRARTGREATAEEVSADPVAFAEWCAPAVKVKADGGEAAQNTYKQGPCPEATPDAMAALDVLDPRSQRVVLGLFVEEKTFAEVAAEEKISDVRVMQIRDAAVEKMYKRLTPS